MILNALFDYVPLKHLETVNDLNVFLFQHFVKQKNIQASSPILRKEETHYLFGVKKKHRQKNIKIIRYREDAEKLSVQPNFQNHYYDILIYCQLNIDLQQVCWAENFSTPHGIAY